MHLTTACHSGLEGLASCAVIIQHTLNLRRRLPIFSTAKSPYSLRMDTVRTFALFTSLPKRHDLIVFDALSHASIREGISASFAKSVKVPHNDVDAIERVLSKWHSTRSRNSLAWIAVESLYSMDGDFAPLAELIEIAERFESMLLVDEAHATGVWGSHRSRLDGTVRKSSQCDCSSYLW